MKYSIVYSSQTGNTRMLAEKLKTILPEGACIYLGPPDKKAADADFIFVGFWTDKGFCDTLISDFMDSLTAKKVFLFGTCGFGGDQLYFKQILSRVEVLLDDSNKITGTYMCQGKMPLSVRNRYESMLTQDPEKFQRLIDNFDLALSHPDTRDLEQLKKAVTVAL